MRVMTRLQNITYVQTLLEKALAGESTPPGPSSTSAQCRLGDSFSFWCSPGSPGYVPPAANFDGETTDGVALGSAAPANKAKKGTEGKKVFFRIGCRGIA